MSKTGTASSLERVVTNPARQAVFGSAENEKGGMMNSNSGSKAGSTRPGRVEQQTRGGIKN